MKNKKVMKQLSVLIAIVAVSACILFSSAITSEEVLAYGSDIGGFAGCFTCVILAPIVCTSYCVGCVCDECVYCVTCGNCELGCRACVEDCGSCVDDCMDCVGCIGL